MTIMAITNTARTFISMLVLWTNDILWCSSIGWHSFKTQQLCTCKYQYMLWKLNNFSFCNF